jgi:hypothetical protein
VFNFHHEGQLVRNYIDKVFAAAKFLGYATDEQQLVDRIVMNLHPSILAQAAFLERPHSRAQLYSAVGLIEERFSVLRERQRTQSVPNASRGDSSRGRETSRKRQVNPQSPGAGSVAGSDMSDATATKIVLRQETVLKTPGRDYNGGILEGCSGTSHCFVMG